MHRRGDLVDVLAPRPLRADCAELDLAFGDRDLGGSARHGPLFCLAAGAERETISGRIDGLHAASASVNLNRPARGSQQGEAMNEAHPPRLLFPALRPLYVSLDPLSWLLIRCACGLILAVHGWARSPAARRRWRRHSRN